MDESASINLSVIAELIEQLEQDLLSLEESLDSTNDVTELVHRTFRTAHNLKSTFGLAHKQASSELVHAIESNFDLIRNGFAKLSALLLHNSLLAVDAMRYSIFLPEERVEDLVHLRKELEALYAKTDKTAEKEVEAVVLSLSPKQEKLLRGMVTENFGVFQIEKIINPQQISRQLYESLPIYDDIREVGIHIATIPDYDNLPKHQQETVIKIILATTFSEDDLGMHIFDSFRPIKPEFSVGSSEKKLQNHATKPNTSRSDGVSSQQKGQGQSLPSENDARRSIKILGSKKQLNILIAEDDFVSRTVIHEILQPFGICDLAADGREALIAYEASMKEGIQYDVICLDIMMPTMDGTQALEKIREYEFNRGLIGSNRAKIIMTTALDSMEQVFKAFRLQCDAYLIKPITKSKVLNQLRKLHIIE